VEAMVSHAWDLIKQKAETGPENEINGDGDRMRIECGYIYNYTDYTVYI